MTAMTAGTAQSVQQLAMDWMVWGSKAGGVENIQYPPRSTPKPTQTRVQRVPGLSWGKGAGARC